MKHPETEIYHCRVCGGSEVRKLLGLRSGLAIYVCGACTNAFTIPVPSVSYDDHGFYQAGHQNEEVSRSYMIPLVQFIQRHIYGGRLLDIGTGAGLLIDEAEKVGFEAEGLEASKSAVQYCQSRGLKVRQGYFEPGLYPGKSFDVIVMSHVLEHTTEPARLLKTAFQLLKEEGVICLSQTNYLGTVPRLLRKYWHAWAPTEHLIHFSPVGIEYLLSEAGFEVIEVQLLPLGYILDLKISLSKAMVAKVLHNVSWLISKLRLGLPFAGDQMYVLARKNELTYRRESRRSTDP
jgi:SAM-dependent methyltransferase